MEQEQKQELTTVQKIINKVRDEYKESFFFLERKKQAWVNNLKIYNNLEKSDEDISSSLFLSSFQTIFGLLYNDKMLVKFAHTDPPDFQRVERLNRVA